MTDYNNFLKYIVPLAIRFGYLPSKFPDGVSQKFMQDLYNCCLKPHTEWEAKSIMFEKWGVLNLDFTYLVSSVIKLMHNYERLIALNEKKVRFVKASCYQPITNSPNDEIFLVQDMLKGFTNPESNYPIIPKIECAKNNTDGGGLCTCYFIEEFEPSPGDDPDFSDWLRHRIKTRILKNP